MNILLPKMNEFDRKGADRIMDTGQTRNTPDQQTKTNDLCFDRFMLHIAFLSFIILIR